MKRIIYSCVIFTCFFLQTNANERKADKGIYEIRIYHFVNAQQEAVLDAFLKNAYLPALHLQKIKNIGVFKPVANDTASDKKIYVLIPYKSIKDFEKIGDKLNIDKALLAAGDAYINAPYDKPVYKRMEKIIVRGFTEMPFVSKPQLSGNRSENIYELRSYEGHTEKISHNKIDMFNKGGEVVLFKRLGFNAVFYGEVLAGATMPNLMYMTSFNNMKERDEHWKAFFSDPAWTKLSADPNYQHNVSKNVTSFLRATDYSDL